MAELVEGAGRSPVPHAGPWQLATVTEVREETFRCRTFRLALELPSPRLAGQAYVVRLTAPDGYQASRTYSVSSPPGDDGTIELTVERLEDGEVSAFLHDVVVVGDTFEVRGPVGGWFVWRGDTPAVLVGGGSGLTPLMAMLRLARRSGRADLVRTVVSARSPADLCFASELDDPRVTVAFTRWAPPGGRPMGRLGPGDLPPVPVGATAYVCGSSPFADAASDLLLGAGMDVGDIRIERFGPS